jgi:hypothetical protein
MTTPPRLAPILLAVLSLASLSAHAAPPVDAAAAMKLVEAN